MFAAFPRAGVGAAMVTLFDANGGIDASAMARLGRWLLGNGCDFLLVFGTTGEGPSLAAAERIAALRAITAAGIPPARIVAGVGCAALADTVALTSAAGELRLAGALIVPPFFFRTASQEGLRDFVGEVLARTQAIPAPVALYHIPEVAGLGYDDATISSLLKAHPGRIQGIKDSTGDAAHAVHWAQAFPDLAIFAGDDHILRPLLAAGGAGPMTATAGLAPTLVAGATKAAGSTPAIEPQEERLNRLWQEALLAFPVTEAVKTLFAHVTGDPRWLRMRLPLKPLEPSAAQTCVNRFLDIDDGAVTTALKGLPEIFSS